MSDTFTKIVEHKITQLQRLLQERSELITKKYRLVHPVVYDRQDTILSALNAHIATLEVHVADLHHELDTPKLSNSQTPKLSLAS